MAGGGYRPDSVPRRVAFIHLGRASPRGSSSQPGDLTHSRWDARTGNPRSPYLALLRMGFTVPPPFPEERCALTAPFHPYPRPIGGGLLSAALSLALPRPGVTRHAACRGVRTFLQDRNPSGRPPPPAAPSIPPGFPKRSNQGFNGVRRRRSRRSPKANPARSGSEDGNHAAGLRPGPHRRRLS